MTAPLEPVHSRPMTGGNGFSVVVPAFDRAATVGRTVASVQRAADEWAAATGGPTEIIVVDDGSSDATATVAGAMAASDARVRLVRQPNAGVSAARNLGAGLATGRWLVFLDCDDEVDPRWLVELGAELDAGARLVFAPAHAIGPDGHDEPWRVAPLGPAFADVEGLFNPGMFALARADFAAVGGYSTVLTFSENTELAIRLTQHLGVGKPIRTATIARPLMTIRLTADGTSNADNPEARLRSALYLLDVHGARLALDPALSARYWSIAGVAAIRLGRTALARRCFTQAARTDPATAAHLIRAVAVRVPALRRRIWSATG